MGNNCPLYLVITALLDHKIAEKQRKILTHIFGLYLASFQSVRNIPPKRGKARQTLKKVKNENSLY